MADPAQISRAVRQTILRHVSRIKIHDIKIREDVDADGDRILRIDVIFDGDFPDPRSVSGLESNLRPVLDKVNESAFPLISFISKADLPRPRRVTA